MISNYIVSIIIIVYSLFKDYDNKSGAKEKQIKLASNHLDRSEIQFNTTYIVYSDLSHAYLVYS